MRPGIVMEWVGIMSKEGSQVHDPGHLVLRTLGPCMEQSCWLKCSLEASVSFA
jgi:hypothetical protein